MRQKKDVLSVAEAKQQLRASLSSATTQDIVTNNLWQAALAAFVIGMLAADSPKTRERLVSLGLSLIKKFAL